ncbi:copper amine oxidase N-terminal domain-containing protein [Paenibacillus daejeonensis]|uniref:copper amine oxidase N-terminal domain-containing protein n=1 Tax=Paenibacillus daejeonensis TaxID=135193 RepID=UPI000381EB46|nr:copper amine oxidase N-terminal domain-containing protein [Paenibacillus daejeonensis]
MSVAPSVVSWPKTGFSVLILFLLFIVPSAVAAEEKIQVYVDRQPVVFSIQPKIQNGSTVVQLRPLFEALDIKLDWNASTKTVRGSKGNQSFSLVIDSPSATVNGQRVTLDSPGRIAGSHTLVPLRFVGEATGAAVGWNAEQRTISIYSSEYQSILGLTKEEAQRQVNQGYMPPAASTSGLSGLYAHHSLDLLGSRSCGGVCWDIFFFVDDRHVIQELPETGVDRLDCAKDSCLTYEVKGGKLTLSNGESYTLEIKPGGDAVIDGDDYTRHAPLGRTVLDGKYEASGYTSAPGGTGLARVSTYVFRPDGTFTDSNWTGVTADGSEDGGSGSGVSSTITSGSAASGTYTIQGYTILFRYKDGSSESRMFFMPDKNDGMLRIGGGDYLLKEAITPYQNLLVEQGLAYKEVLKERTPDFKESHNGIELGLIGYQWAQVDIKTEHQQSFNGFGGKGIIELTAKYTVKNNSSKSIHVNDIKIAVRSEALTTSVLETTDLRSSVKDELKPGESIERLAVVLLPSDRFHLLTNMKLSFENVVTMDGQDLFDGQWLGFSIFE